MNNYNSFQSIKKIWKKRRKIRNERHTLGNLPGQDSDRVKSYKSADKYLSWFRLGGGGLEFPSSYWCSTAVACFERRRLTKIDKILHIWQMSRWRPQMFVYNAHVEMTSLNACTQRAETFSIMDNIVYIFLPTVMAIYIFLIVSHHRDYKVIN